MNSFLLLFFFNRHFILLQTLLRIFLGFSFYSLDYSLSESHLEENLELFKNLTEKTCQDEEFVEKTSKATPSNNLLWYIGGLSLIVIVICGVVFFILKDKADDAAIQQSLKCLQQKMQESIELRNEEFLIKNLQIAAEDEITSLEIPTEILEEQSFLVNWWRPGPLHPSERFACPTLTKERIQMLTDENFFIPDKSLKMVEREEGLDPVLWFFPTKNQPKNIDSYSYDLTKKILENKVQILTMAQENYGMIFWFRFTNLLKSLYEDDPFDVLQPIVESTFLNYDPIYAQSTREEAFFYDLFDILSSSL